MLAGHAGCSASLSETGQHPASNQQTGKKSSWPLPSPEVGPALEKKRSSHRQFPELETLIDIALMEKRLDDVVDLNRTRNSLTDQLARQPA